MVSKRRGKCCTSSTFSISGRPVQQSLQLLQIIAVCCLEESRGMAVRDMPPPRADRKHCKGPCVSIPWSWCGYHTARKSGVTTEPVKQRTRTQLKSRMLHEGKCLIAERDHLPVRHL